MAKTLSRQEVATSIVRSALKTAGLPIEEYELGAAITKSDATLEELIPRYLESGRARFNYGLRHAAKGLALSSKLPPGILTVKQITVAIAAVLPLKLYRCQDPDMHIYEHYGTGKCRIDDTDLVELTF